MQTDLEQQPTRLHATGSTPFLRVFSFFSTVYLRKVASLAISSLLLATVLTSLTTTAAPVLATSANDDGNDAGLVQKLLTGDSSNSEDQKGTSNFRSSLLAAGGWPSLGHDVLNTRFAPLAGNVRPSNVNQLGLKWVFVFPGALSASSQPALVGNTLYVGSWNGHFYALDPRTGALKWDFNTSLVTGPLPTGVANSVRDAPAVAGGRVYFGDTLANFYAVDAATGRLDWSVHVDAHLFARVTGSPLVWNGLVYVGVSSAEEAAAVSPQYPCCTFRGSLVAYDTATGREVWRYYTVPQPQLTGVNSVGTPQYGPAGVAVWSSPALDPLSGTLYISTGNNYTTPATDRAEALIALDARTGEERWHNQLTPNDTWNLACNPESIGLPPGSGPNCRAPNLADNDFDFGSSPNIFLARTAEGQIRTLVGAGQKSGIYHALDATTGQIVWQRQLSQGGVAGFAGIQWGSAWDWTRGRLYVATNNANPGTLFALDAATGAVQWHTPNPANGCTTGGAVNDPLPGDCKLAMPGTVSASPGLVFEGSQDGKLRAFDSRNGSILWQYDTVRPFTGINLLVGKGGSINAVGVSITSEGMIYANSGYQPYPGSGMAGNVLLAFGLN